MALVVEDGTGLTTSNSFAAVADADTFLGDRGFTAWAALTTQAKEYALIAATDYLNSAFAYVGIRVSTTQSLAWPRFSNTMTRLPQGVPVQLKQAVYRVALYIATEGVNMFGVVSSADMVRRVQAGSVSVEFSDAAISAAASGRVLMPWLRDILAGLYASAPDDVTNANGFAMLPVVRT